MNGKTKYKQGICDCGCSPETQTIYLKGYTYNCYWRITNANAKSKRDLRNPGGTRAIGEKKKAGKIKPVSKKAVDPPEFTKNKKQLRFEKLKQHGYLFCDKCERSDARHYEMHHIIFRSEKPGHENLHDKINLIDLCPECHNGFHDNKKSRQYLVIERRLDLVFGLDVLFK